MRIKRILVSSLGALALAFPAAASADSLVNVSGNGIQANPAICANVLSSGACQSTSTGTVTPVSSTGTDGSLVNVTGNAVQVNPSVCANVASTSNCTATTNGTVAPTGTTGGVLGAATGGGLVNLSGNAVQVNPAVCANVLSTGACQSTTTGTTNPPTTCTTNCGGGVLGAATDGPFASVLGASTGLGGGTLPQTGTLGWLALVFSVFGSIATGAVAARRKLT